MGRSGTGVEPRDKSIRVNFTLDGAWQRVRLAIPPTPANLRYAERLVKQVNLAIGRGTFTWEEFFPDSLQAKKGKAAHSFGQWCDLWLATKGRLATKTLNQYRNALNIWKGMFGADSDIEQLSHARVAAAIGSTPWKSAKLLNNYLICLRGVFALAGRDLKLDDPMDGIENSKHQKPQPDPLSFAEMEQVLAHMHKHCDLRMWAYFEVAFFTGMRPEELIALRWGDIDWNNQMIRVERARTAGELKPLKTYNSRDIDLVSRALLALQSMKPWTMMGGVDAEIFQNVETNRPLHDERSQRDHFWTPTLRKLGIRHRRAYQTRHTYATNSLAAGANPAYIARQMGHKNAKMFFTVYAKWIDGADRGREKAKVEAMIGNEKTRHKTG